MLLLYVKAKQLRTKEISNIILNKLIKEYVFYRNGKEESKIERNERLFFYQLVYQSVKQHNYITKNVITGDVKTIWEKCSTIGQPNSVSLLSTNTNRLIRHRKTMYKTFHIWYNELTTIFEELEIVGMELNEQIRIAHFINLLRSDNRYRDIIKHIELNNIFFFF